MPGSTSALPTTGWDPSPLLISHSQSNVSMVGVSRYHAGEYQCSAHNGVGSLAIADLSLTVLCEYNVHRGCYPASVPDPDPDPHIFGFTDLDPLVRGMDHQAKIVKNTLIPTVL